MSITMQELAEIAGVSRSTVDRALNGRGRVNQATKEKICQLAESLGYEPDLAAKMLASKNKILKIGCILNSAGNPFFEDVMAGIHAAVGKLRSDNVQVIIKSVEQLSVECQLKVIDQLVNEGINAIAITPLNDPLIIQRLNALIDDGIAVVALSADIDDVGYLCYVGCDHFKSGRITANVADLLCNTGTNILFVLGSKSLLGHKQRLQGFKAALSAQRADLHIEGILENQDDDFISYRQVYNFLSAHKDIGLIVFAAGGTTGGIRAVQDLNYPCKIISFDLTQSNKQYLQQNVISCILCQNPQTQGYQAVKILSNYLLLGKSPESKRCYTKTEILMRESL